MKLAGLEAFRRASGVCDRFAPAGDRSPRAWLGHAGPVLVARARPGERCDPTQRAEDRIRQLTTRNWGVSMERRIKEINRFTVGWTGYFAFADTILPFEKLEKWLRRRLRQVRWKEWKRPQTRYRNLRALGIPDHAARSWAASQKGYWRVAGSWPLQRALLHRPLPPFPGMLSKPPGADPHTGWCGRGQGKPGLYPTGPELDQQRDDAGRSRRPAGPDHPPRSRARGALGVGDRPASGTGHPDQ
jgi:hypothetical protein